MHHGQRRGAWVNPARESGAGRQSLERCLHHRTHVGVDLVDVRVRTESLGDVDRLEYLGDDLGRQREVRREDDAQPERESEADRQNVHPSFGESQLAGHPIASGQKQLCLLAADGNGGHDGHLGFNGGPDVAGPAVEVDGVRAERGPVGVVVAARENQHDCTRMQCGRGIFPTRFDDSHAAQPPVQRAKEDAVMGQGVDGAVVTELLVERWREDQDVRRDHAARVIRHHQRAARRRHVLQVSHFRAMPAFDPRSDGIRNLLGEHRIPFCGLVIVRRVYGSHGPPLSCYYHHYRLPM